MTMRLSLLFIALFGLGCEDLLKPGVVTEECVDAESTDCLTEDEGGSDGSQGSIGSGESDEDDFSEEGGWGESDELSEEELEELE